MKVLVIKCKNIMSDKELRDMRKQFIDDIQRDGLVVVDGRIDSVFVEDFNCVKFESAGLVNTDGTIKDAAIGFINR